MVVTYALERRSHLGYNEIVDHLSWGFTPQAGSPAEHLGWGGRLYANACFAGFVSLMARRNANLEQLVEDTSDDHE